MIVTINEKKEITNLHIFIEAIQNDKEEIDVDVSGIGNLLEAHNENHKFYDRHKSYKYYLDNDNKLCVRSEAEILGFEKELKIKQLKEKATEVINKKYPTFKQVNSSLDVYETSKKNEIKSYIQGIISQVDAIEATINSKLKLSTLEAVSINITE